MGAKVKKLIIMRGIPGSGKTTKANELMKASPDSVRCSADDFPGYYLNGSYKWSAEACSSAHSYCKSKFKYYLSLETNLIIIDNTNILKRDYKFYKDEAIKNGYKVEICEIPFDKTQASVYAMRNLHNVSEEKIIQMMEKYQHEEA